MTEERKEIYTLYRRKCVSSCFHLPLPFGTLLIFVWLAIFFWGLVVGLGGGGLCSLFLLPPPPSSVMFLILAFSSALPHCRAASFVFVLTLNPNTTLGTFQEGFPSHPRLFTIGAAKSVFRSRSRIITQFPFLPTLSSSPKSASPLYTTTQKSIRARQQRKERKTLA